MNSLLQIPIVYCIQQGPRSCRHFLLIQQSYYEEPASGSDRCHRLKGPTIYINKINLKKGKAALSTQSVRS